MVETEGQFAPQDGAPMVSPVGHPVAPGLPPGVTFASPWLRLGAYVHDPYDAWRMH